MQGSSSGSGEKEAEAVGIGRAASARPDFVSNLGRRLSELTSFLKGLEQEPGSPRLRDDLRRRVHALSTGARHLRFTAMATALAETERLLERGAAVGGLEAADIAALAAIFEGLPSLAHDSQQSIPPSTSAPIGKKGGVPPSVMVVGPAGLADAIANPLDHGVEAEIECERTESTAAALDLARTLAPDVAVVDADLPGAKDLVGKLTHDFLAVPMPIVVVGTWSSMEEGARWVAAGAARAMAKPISPHALRKACHELQSGPASPVHYAPMGHATVEDLTARIAAEVKRGLGEAVVAGQSTSVALGDGSDILAAVWGALARVRDLVTIKSGGEVRFSGLGPEGALPIAPWWGDGSTAGTDGKTGRASEARRDEQVSLSGRKVVVADDDPAVAWFIGGVLRAAGAVVREAHDGKRALEACFRFGPEVVISDVLMPGLDGFALCRALKRDIALRDVPVILLSWKEDLLQRLRDLGADADGYLRKEASATAILERVREVLQDRARLEARLESQGEVRGRLDGVTPRTLLEVTSRLRPDARVRIRDASFLYEMELRGGAPRSATRTTSDGSFQRGKQVFAAVLGVRSGRFVVSHVTGATRGILDGDLQTQMETPIASARAALSQFGGARLLEVQRVEVALDQVEPYLSATPDPARSLILRLAEGASPRELVLASAAGPAEIDDVLTDLATHGAILGIRGTGNVDLLGPALERELFTMRNDAPSSLPRVLAAPAPAEPREPRAEIPVAVEEEPIEEAPSSLEAAVIRQISDPTPSPRRVSVAEVSIVDMSELKTRAPAVGGEFPVPSLPPASLPPDAIIPGNPSDERIQAAERAAPANEEIERLGEEDILPHAADGADGASQESTSPPRITLPPKAVREAAATNLSDAVAALSTSSPAPRRSASYALATLVAVATIAILAAVLRFGRPPTGRESPAVETAAPMAAPGPSSVLVVETTATAAPAPPSRVEVPPTPSRVAAPAAPSRAEEPAAPNRGTAAAAGPDVRGAPPPAKNEDDPIPQGVAVSPGQGLLDVETADRASIFVDGVEQARGFFLRIALTPGTHDVRLHGVPDTSGPAEVRGSGPDQTRQVVIRAGRRTRLLVSPFWTR